MAKPKLKIGLLLNSYFVEAWQYTLVQRLLNSDFLTMKLIVLHPSMPIDTKSNLSQSIQKIYCRFDRKYFHSPNIPDACEIKNLNSLLENVVSIQTHKVCDIPSIQFSDEEIAQIKIHQLDVLIQLSRDRVHSEISHCAQFGVWAYRFGERGFDPQEEIGFREVMEQVPVTSSRLVILNAENGQEINLSESYVTTDKRSVYRNKNNLFWKSIQTLPRNLKNLHKMGGDVFSTRIQRQNNEAISIFSRKDLTFLRTLRFLIRHYTSFIKDKFLSLFFFEQWILLFANTSDSGDPKKYKELVPPKDKFWADPFILNRDKQHTLFIEELSYNENKGHISAIRLDENGRHHDPIKILEKEYHLSYPFIFEHDGKLFMIPETRLNRTIELYECTEFPQKWVHRMNLIENIDAVDTTLFHYNEKWWMFTSILQDREKLYFSDLYYDELYLFYSNSLFSDYWAPHSLNPILSDVRTARPAGRIHIMDGRIIRPSQDCSKSYGYGFRLNEIIRMNEQEYEEKEVSYWQPNWKKSIIATHTFNQDNMFTVIDAVKRRWKWC